MKPTPMRKLWLNQNSFLNLSKKFIIKYLRQVPEDNENYRYDKNELYLYKPVESDRLYQLVEDLNEEISESDDDRCIILKKYFGKELSLDCYLDNVWDYEVHFHVSFIANDDENFIKFLEENPIEGLNVVEIPYNHKYKILEDGVLDHQLLVHGKDFNIK